MYHRNGTKIARFGGKLMGIEKNIVKTTKKLNNFYYDFPDAYMKATYDIRGSELYVYVNVYPSKESRDNKGNSIAKITLVWDISDIEILEFTKDAILTAIYDRLHTIDDFAGVKV